jgi:predicted DNA-binding transcriptional regulator AlpA
MNIELERNLPRGSAPPPPKERYVNAGTVREICGGISDMTLWRWLDNAEMNFPSPVRIGRRRYWAEADVLEWLNAQKKDEAA